MKKLKEYYDSALDWITANSPIILSLTAFLQYVKGDSEGFRFFVTLSLIMMVYNKFKK